MWKKIKAWFVNLIKHKKLKILGFILTWIIPLAFLFYDGMKIKEAHSSFELWAIPVMFVVLIIYYKKIKQKLHDRLIIQGARGVPLGPVYYFITTAVNVLTIYAIFAVFKVIESMHTDLMQYLVICMVCLSLGGICNIIDSINNLPKVETAANKGVKA